MVETKPARDPELAESGRNLDSPSGGDGSAGFSPDGSTTQSPFLAPPLDDFWGHQVAEKAKAKVLGYFAIATIIVAAISFLYGKEAIDRAVEAEVKSAVSAKSPLIDQRLDKLISREQAKIEALDQKLTQLSALLDSYQINAEQKYTSFSVYIRDTTNRAAVLVPSVQGHNIPLASVTQSTIDLSSSIGKISYKGDATPVGEGGVVLYAVASILSKSGRQVELSAEGAFYGAGGDDQAGVSFTKMCDYIRDTGIYLASDWPTRAEPHRH
jgi:hypothetical protein